MNDRCAADALALAGYVAPALPLVLDVAADITCEALVNAVGKEIALLVERRGHAADLILRSPNAAIEPFSVVVNSAIDAVACSAGDQQPADFRHRQVVELRCKLTQHACRLEYVTCFWIDLIHSFAIFFADGSRRISDLRVMSEAEKDAALYQCNETTVAFDRSALVHRLIEAQAVRSPDAIALVCEDRSLTYRELDLRG